MALVQLMEKILDVERRARLHLEHTDASLDLDAQLLQLLDIGEELPPHALLVRRRQISQGFDREFERSDHRGSPPAHCFSPATAECNYERWAPQGFEPR